MPQISVVLPVYEADASQLALSITSVMMSDCEDLELVVGLDGPAQPDVLGMLMAVVACTKFTVRVLELPRQGLVATLNSLIEASDSSYIARQDADDYSLPLRFSRQRYALESDRANGFCGTQVCRCNAQLRPRVHQRCYPTGLRGQLAYASLFNNPIAHPSLMLRRSALQGLRYKEVPGAEDWQLYADLWQRGVRSFNLASTELLYRTHPGQITARKRDDSILKHLHRESYLAARIFGLDAGLLLPYRLSQSFGLSEKLLSLRGHWRKRFTNTP
jgi:glycosyltransferase EpsE